MTNVLKKHIPKSQQSKNTEAYYLDKLETTSDFFISKSHETQYHKGLHKHTQNTKLKALISVLTKDKKHWNKQYLKTFFCSHVMLQDGDRLIGSLCRKRWCQHCNRIKTAELINGYLEPLEDLAKEDQLYFVTLTAPTCEARELKSQISARLKSFTRIKDNMRKRHGLKLHGYRKIEITFTNGKYHPHLHLIVKGYAESIKLRELWLKNQNKANIKAQDIRPIEINDNNLSSLKELFKYATKGIVSNSIEAAAEHIIHRALVGTRIYQPYGKIKKVKKPIEEKQEFSNCDWLPFEREIYVYEQHKKDWINAKNQNMVGTILIEQNIIKKKQEYEKTR